METLDAAADKTFSHPKSELWIPAIVLTHLYAALWLLRAWVLVSQHKAGAWTKLRSIQSLWSIATRATSTSDSTDSDADLSRCIEDAADMEADMQLGHEGPDDDSDGQQSVYSATTVVAPAHVAWLDVACSYSTSKGTIPVLEGVCGTAAPGELVAVLGPSGAGKSMLLDILSGRKKTGQVTGQVLFNGQSREAAASQGIATAYVPQEDTFLPSLTVHEVMRYYARLMLPASASPALQQRRILAALDVMGMRPCAETLVGGQLPGGIHLQGLSGGEKKRLSIAVGTLQAPSLVLLDEPTTGLDSAAALLVMAHLKSLAQHGHSVIATIHQPRMSIWNMIDKVQVLSQGLMLYFGPPSSVLPWFCGHLHYSYNPKVNGSVSDWLMDMVNISFNHDDKDQPMYEEEDVPSASSLMCSHAELQQAATAFKAHIQPPSGHSSLPKPLHANASQLATLLAPYTCYEDWLLGLKPPSSNLSTSVPDPAADQAASIGSAIPAGFPLSTRVLDPTADQAAHSGSIIPSDFSRSTGVLNPAADQAAYNESTTATDSCQTATDTWPDQTSSTCLNPTDTWPKTGGQTISTRLHPIGEADEAESESKTTPSATMWKDHDGCSNESHLHSMHSMHIMYRDSTEAVTTSAAGGVTTISGCTHTPLAHPHHGPMLAQPQSAPHQPDTRAVCTAPDAVLDAITEITPWEAEAPRSTHMDQSKYCAGSIGRATRLPSASSSLTHFTQSHDCIPSRPAATPVSHAAYRSHSGSTRSQTIMGLAGGRMAPVEDGEAAAALAQQYVSNSAPDSSTTAGGCQGSMDADEGTTPLRAYTAPSPSPHSTAPSLHSTAPAAHSTAANFLHWYTYGGGEPPSAGEHNDDGRWEEKLVVEDVNGTLLTGIMTDAACDGPQCDGIRMPIFSSTCPAAAAAWSDCDVGHSIVPGLALGKQSSNNSRQPLPSISYQTMTGDDDPKHAQHAQHVQNVRMTDGAHHAQHDQNAGITDGARHAEHDHKVRLTNGEQHAECTLPLCDRGRWTKPAWYKLGCLGQAAQGASSAGEEIDLVKGMNERGIRRWWHEVVVLLWREWVSITRNPTDVAGRVVLFSWTGVFVGALFYRLPVALDTVVTQVMLIFVEMCLLLLLPFCYMPLHVTDKRYFIADVAAGRYQPSAYLAAKTLMSLPFAVINSATFVLTVYGLAGITLHAQQLGVHLALSVLLYMVGNQVLFCSAVCTSNQDGAFLISVAWVALNILYSKVFLRYNDLKYKWLVFPAYVSAMNYAIDGYTSLQLAGGGVNCSAGFTYNLSSFLPPYLPKMKLMQAKVVQESLARPDIIAGGSCSVPYNQLLTFFGVQLPVAAAAGVLLTYLLTVLLASFVALRVLAAREQR